MSLHINQLSCETIQLMLEYLPLKDRKSASMVCRLWNQEAFSARLQSSMQLRIIPDTKENINKLSSVLQKSCRSYRNIYCMMSHRPVEIKFVKTVLDKFGSNIEGLIVNGTCTWAWLTVFLIRTPNLKDLWVHALEAGNCQPKQRAELPVLTKLYNVDMRIIKTFRPSYTFQTLKSDVQHTAPNVQRLRIMSEEPHWMFEILNAYASQLQSVDICEPHKIRIHDLHFERLQVLKLRNGSNYPDNMELPRLFHRLPLLRELYTGDYGICHSLLEVICQNCPLLRTLDIRTCDVGNRSFKCLGQLKNLQVLGLGSFKPINIGQCEPMPTVIEVHLVETPNDSLSYHVDQLYEVFPNVKTINLNYRSSYGNMTDQFLVSGICRKFIRLKKLTLVCKFSGTVTVKGFEPPNGLGNVEELTLHAVALCFDPSIELSFNNVKRLTLKHFNSVCWKDFEDFFPNLRYLQILNHQQKIDSHLIGDIRRSIPDYLVN